MSCYYVCGYLFSSSGEERKTPPHFFASLSANSANSRWHKTQSFSFILSGFPSFLCSLLGQSKQKRIKKVHWSVGTRSTINTAALKKKTLSTLRGNKYNWSHHQWHQNPHWRETVQLFRAAALLLRYFSLDNYWMGYHDILYIHVPQRMNLDFGDALTFPLVLPAGQSFHFTVNHLYIYLMGWNKFWCRHSWSPLDESLITLVIPWLFLHCHHEVDICGFKWNVWKTVGWIAMKYGTHIMPPSRIICNNVGDFSSSAITRSKL